MYTMKFAATSALKLLVAVLLFNEAAAASFEAGQQYMVTDPSKLVGSLKDTLKFGMVLNIIERRKPNRVIFEYPGCTTKTNLPESQLYKCCKLIREAPEPTPTQAEVVIVSKGRKRSTSGGSQSSLSRQGTSASLSDTSAVTLGSERSKPEPDFEGYAIESKTLFNKREAKVNGSTRYFKIKGKFLKCYGGRGNRQRETINLDNVENLQKINDTKIRFADKYTNETYIITDRTATAMEVANFLKTEYKLKPNQVNWKSFGEKAPLATAVRRRLQESRARRRRLLERLQGF